MRRVSLLALPVLGLLGAALYKAPELQAVREFKVSGIIRISPELRERAEKPNNVLYVVARTRSGIPVALQRIINPQFPQRFALSRQDVVFPGLAATEPVRLEAAVSSHGQPGAKQRGDLAGEYPNKVEAGEGPVPITIDRVENGG